MKPVLTSRRRLAGGLFACAAVLAGLAPGLAAAQAFPNKPVRLVVTYPPGGSSDLMARIMAGKLSELWGHQVLIESKPGAAGSIGMEFAARQAPDGYTFVIGNLGPAAVNPLISKVPYTAPTRLMRPPTAAKITISIDGTMPTKDGDIKPTCSEKSAPPMPARPAARQNVKMRKLATS